MKKHCDLRSDPTERSDSLSEDDDYEGRNENETDSSDGNRKEVCHTMTMKKCETSYRPQMTKVKVRVCPDDINLDKESAQKMKNRY